MKLTVKQINNLMATKLKGEITPGPGDEFTLKAWRAVGVKRYFSFAFVYTTQEKAAEAAMKYHVDINKTEAELTEAAMDRVEGK